MENKNAAMRAMQYGLKGIAKPTLKGSRVKFTVLKDKSDIGLLSPRRNKYLNNVSTDPEDIWAIIDEGIEKFGINLDKRGITLKNLIDIIGLMDLKITNL